MAPNFPDIQHVNRPAGCRSKQELPMTMTPSSSVEDVDPFDMIPLSYRICCPDAQVEWHTQFGGGSVVCDSDSLCVGKEMTTCGVGDSFNTELDIRGLWVKYMSLKYSGSSDDSYDVDKVIDISQGDEKRDDIIKYSVSPADPRLGYNNLKLSVNNYLKEANLSAINKVQDVKRAELNSATGGQPLTGPLSSPLAPKGSLAAAQVISLPNNYSLLLI